jgi:hypothetical protein
LPMMPFEFSQSISYVVQNRANRPDAHRPNG